MTQINAEKLAILRKQRDELAYENQMNRIMEQYKAEQHRLTMMEFSAIDSSLTRSKLPTERAVTKQLELDRRSIHDCASNNLALVQLMRHPRTSNEPLHPRVYAEKRSRR